ncbi:ricin-type beta-trefoil lectin domain protein [Kitasatospora sp. NPDC002227]|uniref:ricin-type beta-trefoil lectin domain protein n=1 Tax=Kitasatospora sp. NPDC002227 TaxID=3154773 RepID=UPI0033233063
MAFALRKTITLAALVLTASFLPAGSASAAPALHPGVYCLANAWGTPDVGTKPCDANDQGQHWAVMGDQIALAQARAYCLANPWGSQTVTTKGCDGRDPGQYWSVSGDKIFLTNAPAYCLANAYGTPNVGTKPCDVNDPGQHWDVFGDQISLAYAG